MLDFCKNVLLKVSFSKKLFKKELMKAICWLDQKERLMLKAWCLSTFGTHYKDTIIEVFRQIPVDQIS
jgi:hypothetical protein